MLYSTFPIVVCVYPIVIYIRIYLFIYLFVCCWLWTWNGSFIASFNFFSVPYISIQHFVFFVLFVDGFVSFP